MGDDQKAALSKAMQELEELYLGVPDESVNLSFKDLAGPVANSPAATGERKLSILLMEPILENESAVDPTMSSRGARTPPEKLPSIDFSKGLQQASLSVSRRPSVDVAAVVHNNASHGLHEGGVDQRPRSPLRDSLTFDDISVLSGVSCVNGSRGGIKRPGIPHSNICTICSDYVYFFRHRCLVCGRVYCRQCVSIGMGEMSEGRKCMECLGRRFSQRYIKKAGEVGCCMGYPSTMKQREMRWAEMGPRRRGERRYGVSGGGLMSRSRSPVMPRTTPPTWVHVNGSATSFVTSGTFSPTAHHIPF
ncbi:hypothetical protein H6P81_017769 [Aristolochia fimbriata]|uniref:FYVE-type domain-containing protein n=1 Tax=Aristolochia fimbriata TaxID=158543 RepID=A0AAV7DZ44_ARIFI|nr:hypothetical protein H6P81_017769 [Aristolochia fimbriata]